MKTFISYSPKLKSKKNIIALKPTHLLHSILGVCVSSNKMERIKDKSTDSLYVRLR